MKEYEGNILPKGLVSLIRVKCKVKGDFIFTCTLPQKEWMVESFIHR